MTKRCLSEIGEPAEILTPTAQKLVFSPALGLCAVMAKKSVSRIEEYVNAILMGMCCSSDLGATAPTRLNVQTQARASGDKSPAEWVKQYKSPYRKSVFVIGTAAHV